MGQPIMVAASAVGSAATTWVGGIDIGIVCFLAPLRSAVSRGECYSICIDDCVGGVLESAGRFKSSRTVYKMRSTPLRLLLVTAADPRPDRLILVCVLCTCVLKHEQTHTPVKSPVLYTDFRLFFVVVLRTRDEIAEMTTGLSWITYLTT